jgi:glycosyltransferase involved in cell wall biosynthesis
VRRQAGAFDVLHFHIDVLHYPIMASLAGNAVTTLHGRLDLPDLKPFYRMFPDFPLVSISHHQRLPMPPVRWAGTVHHGLPRDLLPFTPHPAGDYLAFLGRISPEKRPDRAIEIAAGAGMPLKIAAKIDRHDRSYWSGVIEPMIARHRNVEFIGEIDERSKGEFLGNARALLFPIDWPEPFGLVTIEAMACGTPVIAFPCGSVPEIIDQGVTGSIVDSVDQGIQAVKAIDAFDRARVRATFERRFSVERMTDDYLAIYRDLTGSSDRRRTVKGDLKIVA